MTEYASQIIFNSVVLNVQSLNPVRVQKTRKSVVGKSLAEIKIIGLADQQWELDIDGIIYGTTSANVSTNRAAVEALDSVTAYAYTDGIHNGTYFMKPGSLKIKDKSDDVGGKYDYSMVLVEE